MVSTSGASGPIWVRPSLSAPTRGKCPVVGTRPAVGFKPSRPHHAAGRRMLPPESLPRPSSDAPAAMATASPELEPPGVRPASSGCRTAPPGAPSSHDRVLATTTAPAPRNLATTVASTDGRRPRARPPSPAQGKPSTSIQSFTVTGRPCNGPSGPPSARARSRARASASARSSSNAAIAPVTSSRSCSRARRAAMTSSTRTSPVRTAASSAPGPTAPSAHPSGRPSATARHDRRTVTAGRPAARRPAPPGPQSVVRAR
jgi:hypothetical protein